ncbi:MAG: 50S ribosomal protein L13 [Bacteroidetes bacterium QS_9_68_14]|nr:MAG: 50S ribosomal protein L13 [Bacteroidetes bacterium QS_9_68_14]
MNTNSFQTFSAKPAEVERTWYHADAAGERVGRLASRVARVLRGKHKPTYTPHVDTGDFVIVTNAAAAIFSGRKEIDKEYFQYSGYPGGGKTATPAEVRSHRPTFVVEHAVRGMLPEGSLGEKMAKKLKVYEGAEHPHEAQQPQELPDDK